MQKHLNGKKLPVAALLAVIMLGACSKEVETQTFDGNSADKLLSQESYSIRDTFSLVHFFRGSFISQVNTTTRTDSNVVVFDFIFKKRFSRAGNNAVSVPFGDAQFADRGWKYEITYDSIINKVSLAPNDIMSAGIVSGSFKIVQAGFDKVNQSFNFITRFTELNGNKNDVGETLSKQ